MNDNEVIKCTCLAVYTFAELSENNFKCRKCRKPVVMKNTQDVKELSAIERIKQQQNIIKALAIPNLEQNEKDVLTSSLGLIALTNGAYSIAGTHFKNLIASNENNTEAYYYYSLSLLNGKRPFLNSRSMIDLAIENLNFAFAIDAKGKYLYLKALLIEDFYKMKYIRYGEDVQEILNLAYDLEITEEEKQEIFELLNMKQRPAGF